MRRGALSVSGILRRAGASNNTSVVPVMLRSVSRLPSPRYNGVERVASLPARSTFSSTSASASEEAVNEELITALLKKSLGEDAEVVVVDTSGGCGSFFRIEVVAESFRDVSLVKQHRMVNDALSQVTPLVHGITIKTNKPQN